MNEKKYNLVWFRNWFFEMSYIYILKPFFFLFDPEDVHDEMIAFGVYLGKYRLTKFLTKLFFHFKHPALNQNILGINFPNPVGLSAGFDKNAELLDILPSVGFGFTEVGSITGYPCKGNPRPRLWRLPKSEGLVVYYGLKNDGAVKISKNLKNKKVSIPFGTNIAMTNCQANLDIEKAIADYVKAFRSFVDIGQYFVVNISCPNAEGGQPFMNPNKLDHLLNTLDKIQTAKPVFVKISPDISFSEVDAILEVLERHRVDGVLCGNLTKKKNNPLIVETLPRVGGVSGLPVRDMSTALISYIYKKVGYKLIIIGCGGIFSAEDAYAKIRAGASLVELITGMIFRGPQLINSINFGLVELLKRDGFSNISEAIGADSN